MLPDPDDAQTGGGLSRTVTLTFAAAAGLSIANTYHAQPLLDAIAQALGIAQATVGLIVTLTQIGYGLGLGATFSLFALLVWFGIRRLSAS